MEIKACTFDVFGTCVDWRGSVESMLRNELRSKGLIDRLPDVPDLAQTWRNGYSAYNKSVASGEVSQEKFETIDVVHRRLLDDLVKDHALSEVWTSAELDEMNLVWHRLTPWADTSAGIEALKKVAIVSTLSNGNMRLLVDQAKYGDMDWDILLSSELFKSAKPNSKVYLGACQMLALAPQEVCMVACHMADLEGAKKCGLRTAYIRRPQEDDNRNPHEQGYIDYVIDKIGDLAEVISKRPDLQ